MCRSGVQYSTVQYTTVQYSTLQYSTVQYSTVQCIVPCTQVSTSVTQTRIFDSIRSSGDNSAYAKDKGKKERIATKEKKRRNVMI